MHRKKTGPQEFWTLRQALLPVRRQLTRHRNRLLVARVFWVLILLQGSVPELEVRSLIYDALQMLGGEYFTGSANTAIL